MAVMSFIASRRALPSRDTNCFVDKACLFIRIASQRMIGDADDLQALGVGIPGIAPYRPKLADLADPAVILVGGESRAAEVQPHAVGATEPEPFRIGRAEL